MNALYRSSPAKRKSTHSASASGVSRRPVQQGDPNWPCPGPDCDGGHLKVVNKRDGKGKFAPCDRNNNRDEDSCSVSCTILTPSTTYPKPCQLRLAPVGGTPSLGIPTDQVNSRGYKEWNNIHAVWRLCAGAKSSDGKKFKHVTVAPASLIRVHCECSDAVTNEEDLADGCTGEIVEDDLIIKDWDSPPLHYQCARRLWDQTINEILNKTDEHRDLGTTHDKESSQPSAAVQTALADL